jgi:hypothetical protein
MYKQSSIEWFISEFNKQIEFRPDSELDVWFKALFPKAIEMYKEDLESAYFCGSCDRMNDEGSFEQYYKETYERQDNKH